MKMQILNKDDLNECCQWRNKNFLLKKEREKCFKCSLM